MTRSLTIKPVSVYNNCVYNSSNSLLKDILTTSVNDAINELNYNGSCTDYTLNYSYKCQNEPSGQTASKSVNFTSDVLIFERFSFQQNVWESEDKKIQR